MYLIVCGINTTNNNPSDIKKSILAILYLSIMANIKLSSVVENIKNTILLNPIIYLIVKLYSSLSYKLN
ncbi:hypothetical protein CGC43_02095 [Francisella opportunistica]|uniref:Uncharacterized protein n=1 Tax=Francisella opportunistica TaxID=2016517 RepID=A0A345JQ63_9GAMM|nr:hypothetical protein CGC43_02095 [Francisella opportunistica]